MNVSALTKSPAVSILVITYKNTQHLPNCLESIFSQTYDNIELIVNNDCSDDFDVAEIEAYIQSKRTKNITSVIVNKNEVNLGSCKNFNKALSFATGEYVMLMPCDDEYNNKNSIKDMIEGFGSFSGDVQVILGQVELRDENLMELDKYMYPEDIKSKINQFTQDEILEFYWVPGNPISVTGAIFDRNLLTRIGGLDEDYFLYTDRPLFIRIAQEGGQVRFLDAVCSNERGGGIRFNFWKPHDFASKKGFQDLKRLFFKAYNFAEISTWMKMQAKLIKAFAKKDDEEFTGYPVVVDAEKLVGVDRNIAAECIMFGCCEFEKIIFPNLSRVYRILAYSDDNPKLWGNEMNGLPIVPPSELINFGEADIVICSHIRFFEIAAELTEMGLGPRIVLPQILIKEGDLV